jgi:hypothetical protein
MDFDRGRRPSSPTFELLEPRVLFAADAAGAAAVAAEAVAAFSAAPAQAAATSAPPTPAPSAETGVQPAASRTTPARELVVVDTRAPDLARLLADLDAQRQAGRPLDVVTVDAGTDGLSVVTDRLAQQAGAPYDAVHLIGHGEPGSMRLGSASLDLTTLRARAGEIAGWSAGLGADADLLLWGCDVAADGDGRALVDGLAALTGADVAASVDATGGLQAGGDWTLEVSTGAIEAGAPIGAALQAAFDGTLGFTPQGTGDTVVVDSQVVQEPGDTASTASRTVAAGPAGSVVVWIADNGPTDRKVMAQRYLPDGTPLGGALNVAAGGDTSRTTPAVAMDADGNFIVAWAQDSSVRVRYWNADAADGPVGFRSAFRVDSAADTLAKTQVSVALSQDGTHGAVAWCESNESRADVNARRLRVDTGAAAVWGGEILVTDYQGFRDTHPDVAVLNDGSFAVAFQGSNGSVDGRGIWLRRYGAGSDTPLGTPVLDAGERVVAATNDTTVRPSLAVAADGAALVVWQEGSGTATSIVARRFDMVAGFTGQGGAFRVDTSAGLTVGRPSVSAFPAGGFMVAWEASVEPAGAGWGIQARHVDATGTLLGAAFAANANTVGNQRAPSVAAAADRVLFAWVGVGADADALGLRAFSVDPNQLPTGAVAIAGTPTENQTLSAGTGGIGDADGLGAFTYQWLRDGVAVVGATGSTYLLGDADVGAQISLRVAWTDGWGTPESLTSAPTAAIANVNDAPTGSVLIGGSWTENQTLSANTTGIADADGLGAFTYQWLRNGAAVAGATGTTYLLGDADVGTRMSLRIAYTDARGTAETLTSGQTGLIANVNDAPAGLPVITGTATEDQALGADTTGIADADGLGAFTYQWRRDGVAIAGATGTTYLLGDADVGRRITVRVSYTDAWGTAETVTSAQTAPVANVNDAPTGVVTISGTTSPGQTLTALAGEIADADGLGVFGYQWLRDGANIAGATAADYLLDAADVGTRISVRVSWTDGQGTAESLVSAQTPPIASVNTPPTGSVVIAGTPTEDQTLSADTAGIADADGLGAFTYQWLRDGVAVVGATGSTYLLGDADVGAQIGVRVSYLDGGDTVESLTSAPTAAIANVNDAPTGSVLIGGTRAENQTLSANTTGIGDADGLGAFTYQWRRDGVAVAGATGATYLLGDADVGTRMSLRIAYTDARGTAETLTSAQTGLIANVNDAPAGLPVITGTATEDQALGADTTGIADADGLGAFTYQWRRDGVAIAGATGTTYLLGDADVGRRITVRVSYTDAWGTAETVTSAQTAPVANVNDAPTGSPVVSGTPTEDHTLTAVTSGIGDADGLGTFSLQWLRDGVAVAGATGTTYLPGDADVGAQISVRVTWTDARGTAESLTSASTAAIANVNDPPVGSVGVSGTQTEDQTLTAVTSGISDADGLGTFTYQWLRDGVAVAGATGTTYLLGDADVGTQIGVRVSWIDAMGTNESLVSNSEVAPVANLNDAPTGAVAISGVATEDQTLGADTTDIGDADGLGAFTYQWLRDGAVVAGATGATYLLGDADVGARIVLRVSWIDGQGTVETLDSAATAPISNVNDAPVIASDGGGASATIVVDENTTAVTTVVAQDADGDALVYALADGADRARFAIDAATGALRFLAPPDHEAPADADGDNVYEVVVSASDGQVAALQTLRLRVADVNEAPTLRAPASVAALEDTPRLLSAADGSAIVVGDPDADQAELTIDLMVDRGTLTLGTRAGLRFEGGSDGVDDASIRVSGSPADIADALARLVYLPPTDASGAAVLTLVARDPALPQLAASVSIAIGIAAVNDAPVPVAPPPVFAQQGEQRRIGADVLRTTDVDDGPSEIVYTVVAQSADGRLRVDGTPLAPGARFTQADVDSGRLSFVGRQAGLHDVVLAVSDGSGTAGGSVTMSVKVNVTVAAATAAGGSQALAVSAAASVASTAAGGEASGSADAASGPDSQSRAWAPSSAAAPSAGSAASRGAGAAGSAAPAGAPAAAGRAGAAGAEESGVFARPSGGAAGAGAGGRSSLASGVLRDMLPAAGDVGPEGADAGGASQGAGDATPGSVRYASAAGAFARLNGGVALVPPTPSVAAAWSPVAALAQPAFREQLADVREQATARTSLDRVLAASTTAVGASLSIVYGVWLLRGGVLLTSLLASMPAWRSIDPTPVLGRTDARGRDDATRDDSLRGMLRSAAERAQVDAALPGDGVPAVAAGGTVPTEATA